jgi:hypothetical protein
MTVPRRRLGAQAHHLAGRLLRSSFTQLGLRSLRCSAPTHDLAHLDNNSLAANRWIASRATRREVPSIVSCAPVGAAHTPYLGEAPEGPGWALRLLSER